MCLLALKARSYSLPVNDVPDRLKILSLAVLVLQIVRVFPCVNAHERLERSGNWVLVGACHQAKGAALLILDKPRPTTALDACQCGVHLFAKGIKGAEIFLDRFLKVDVKSAMEW